jgi:hypothetical protein
MKTIAKCAVHQLSWVQKESQGLFLPKKKEEGPRDLPRSDLPTPTDVECYFYLMCVRGKNYFLQIHLVEDKLIQILQKCNLRLPLQQMWKVYDKVKGIVDSVKVFDQKKLKM